MNPAPFHCVDDQAHRWGLRPIIAIIQGIYLVTAYRTEFCKRCGVTR